MKGQGRVGVKKERRGGGGIDVSDVDEGEVE